MSYSTITSFKTAVNNVLFGVLKLFFVSVFMFCSLICFRGSLTLATVCYWDPAVHVLPVSALT